MIPAVLCWTDLSTVIGLVWFRVGFLVGGIVLCGSSADLVWVSGWSGRAKALV